MTVAIGIQVGIAVASIALSYLLRPKPDDIEGPRAADTAVTTSGYGRYIGFGFGTVRKTANRIWVKNNKIDEVSNTEKIGGKGLGGGATSTNYSYFGTWADSFGEGPAVRARRIWFNSKLVYDLDGEVVQKPNLHFVFHRGNQTQTPDPLIESFIDAQFGAGSTPAYRGQCYIVFVDVPLADYGNSLPSVEIELEYGTGGATAFTTTTVDTSAVGTNINSNNVQIDFDRRRAYIGNNGTFNDEDAYGAFDIDAMSFLGLFSNNFDLAGIGHDGNLFGSRGSDEATNKLAEPYSGSIIKDVAHGGAADDASLGRGIQISLVGPMLSNSIYVCKNRDGFFPVQDDEYINLIYADGDDFGLHYRSEKPYGTTSTPRFGNVVEASRGSGRAWVVGNPISLTEIDIWQVTITGPIESALIPLAQRQAVKFEKVATFTTADFDSQGGGVTVIATDAAYDPSDDSLVAFARLSGPARTYVFKWSPALGILWKTSIQPHEPSAAGAQHRLAGNTFAWPRHDASNIRVTMVSLADGAILVDDELAAGITGFSGQWLYDDQSRTLYTAYLPLDDFQKTRIGATARPTETRANIISAYCRRAGLLASEIDVTGVAGTVGGWLQPTQSVGAAALQPFLDTFLIDTFTNAGKLTFNDRGAAVAGTILENDLMPDNDGVVLKPRKVQEHELPETVQILFRDIEKDHLDADQSFKRIRLPNAARTIETRQTFTLSLPLSETGAIMRAVAVRQMMAAWNEREVIEAVAPVSFSEFLPGDALTLEREDGSTQRVRVASMPFGVDMTYQIALLVEDVTQYAATIATDSGSYQGQTVPLSGPSKAFLLNTTIIRDLDATDRTFGRLTWAAAPYAEGGTYPGAVLYRLLGDTDFAALSRVASGVDWGVVTAVYPASDRPHIVEFGSTMDLVMVRGGDDLATTTLLNMTNGENSVLIAKGDGTGEVMGFVQATDLGSGNFRLTDLLHGRRGTEGYMAGVAVGDSVIVLNRSNMNAFAMALSEIGVERDYKVVTSGSFLELAAPLAHTYTGDDRKPWAPGHLTGQESTGDIIISWVRRTRHSGEWNDGTGNVPLNEDSEEYEIDILDGPGGSIVQSATGLSTPTYTYLSADITTDFVDVADFFATGYVRVYQISAQAGRGFTNETQVEEI